MSTKDDLAISIKAVGDEIRALKESKADAAEITQRVNLLKTLKSQYQELTGQPYEVPKEAPKEAKTVVAAVKTEAEVSGIFNMSFW